MDDRSRRSPDPSPSESSTSAETVDLAGSETGGEPVATPEGASVGRYAVLEEIGRGGMGRVLRAYDPKLQREVALKEVRKRALGPEGASRLVAEARAMARLSHPNVVGVYDVEEIGAGQVVLVMELVAGQSLRAWSMQPRTWQETLSCYRRAGRGLAAAHAAGILHRDFKPDNVLVADADVVKVTDFGLAKLGEQDSSTVSGPVIESGEESGSRSLSATGMVMGTPRYMAPEQHRGAPLTAAADQYAFCVALWDALVGTPPFGERGIEALARAKAEGPPAWPGGPVPRRIGEAIRRGLAPDPATRWPGMDELLEALAHDPARRRRRVVQAALGVGVVAVSVGAVQAWASARAQLCSEAAAVAHLDGVWDERRRAEVEAAILGIGASFAQDVWARTRDRLDAYASDWAHMHVESCEATTVRAEQPPAVMDLRMGCLHRAAVELKAVVTELARADAATVQEAHALVSSLPSLDRCADVEALEAEVEPPLPSEAATVEEVRAHTAASKAARAAGHYDEAREEIEAAKALVAGIGYAPARTEVVVQEGILEVRVGDYPAAERALREGLRLGLEHQQWDSVQDAVGELMYVVGFRQQRFDESDTYLELAQGLARTDPKRQAFLSNQVASVLDLRGEYAAAEAEARRALALQEESLGRDHPDVAHSHGVLGRVLFNEGRYDEAEAEIGKALSLTKDALGPDHPTVGNYHNNLAGVLMGQGKLAEAEAEYRAAIAIELKAFGPDATDAASARGSLAIVLNNQGRHEEAEAEVRRALEILTDESLVALCRNTLATVLLMQGRAAEAEEESRKVVAHYEKLLGPEHPDVATVRDNLGVILTRQGKYAEAEAEHRRSLEVREKAHGAEHPAVATSLNNLGVVLHKTGRLDEAVATLRRALEMRETILGAEHPIVALARSRLAAALIERGDAKEALELAEDAWRLRKGDDTPPAERAETAFVLARARWLEGGADERAGALALAERALDDHAKSRDGGGERAEAVRDWLSTHRPR